MIANTHTSFYQYNPYNKKLTKESYDHQLMKVNRSKAIQHARNRSKACIILGTLGR